MLKTKFYLIFLISLIPFCPLKADDSDSATNSMIYLKMGAAVLPSDLKSFLPFAGIGLRFQANYLGYDLSSNVATTLLNNYISLKAMAMVYPFSIIGHSFYFGVGAAAGYRGKISLHGKSTDYTGVTLEGVFGYEFQHYRCFRKFLQVEVSQPLINHRGNSLWRSKTPGFTFTSGIGF